MATTELAPPPPKQTSGLTQVKGWLNSDAFKDAISKALPSHMTPERFLRVALTATMKTPKLLTCTQESLFNCLLQCSQYGLEPDGRRAHLIPFDVKKKNGNGQWVVDHTDCTLIIDYKGYAELVMRSGLVSNIHADVICDNDEFEADKGQILHHRIDYKNDRGDAYAAYAIVTFKDGTEKCEIMQKADIYAVRDGSQGWYAFKMKWTNQSPWNPSEPFKEREMWKKTVFRRLTKWVPLSAEIRDAMSAEDDSEDRILQTTAVSQTVPALEGSKSDALADMLASRMSGESDEYPEEQPGSGTDDDQRTGEPEMKSETTTDPKITGQTLPMLKTSLAKARTLEAVLLQETRINNLPEADREEGRRMCEERKRAFESN